MELKGNVIIYENSQIEVTFHNNSLWLNQYQIATLFDVNRTTIQKHIKNIYTTEELEEKATCAFFAQVQKEGKRTVTRNIKTYNLDLIISVGYRVNSKKGTQFRIWATNILKQHLVKGYSVNSKRLEQLQKTIQLVNRTSKISNEAKDLLDILSDYSKALSILDDYDHRKITKKGVNKNATFKISYHQAKDAIEKLRVKFGGSDLFGREKDKSFKSSIAVIDQTFDGKELYLSLEEKAANLLYFVVKNHSFTDGNKRIAAWLFIWYLHMNNYLYKDDGTQIINNNTLATLTLMIAESKPSEKEIIIDVIMNLITT